MLEQLVARDEAVDIDLRASGPSGRCRPAADRPWPASARTARSARCAAAARARLPDGIRNGSGIGIVARLGAGRRGGPPCRRSWPSRRWRCCRPARRSGGAGSPSAAPARPRRAWCGPVPMATIAGFSVRSVASSRAAARSATPAAASGAAGSVGTTSQWARWKCIPEPGRQLHAGGDRVLQAEGDQALGETERDQALRGGARDLQRLGDFVLRMAGDEVEPAGPRRLVEACVVIVG